ncbi:MAG: arsenate reductase family protein [Egibacteraceae bacterium]
MADIQLLGHPSSKATGKARRFFSERRVPVHYVDLRKRAPTPGELRKWIQRFGHEAMLDPTAKAYREQGLSYVSVGEDSWLERMSADPTILRLPLVRCGKELAVGEDPVAWQRFVDAVKS